MPNFETAPIVGLSASRYENPDDPRYHAALAMIEGYQRSGLPIIIVDDSNQHWVSDSFKLLGADVIQAPEHGLAASYMHGIEYALKNGAKRIMHHEPEKDMARHATVINDALDEYPIVIIGRTERAMNTLPSTQQKTETLAGKILGENIGFPADSFSGGRAYTNTGAQYFLDYNPDAKGKTWMLGYETIVRAMRDDVPIGGVLVDLLHPKAMTQQEQGNPDWDAKRYMQFRTLVPAILAEAGIEYKPVDFSERAISRLQ